MMNNNDLIKLEEKRIYPWRAFVKNADTGHYQEIDYEQYAVGDDGELCYFEIVDDADGKPVLEKTRVADAVICYDTTIKDGQTDGRRIYNGDLLEVTKVNRGFTKYVKVGDVVPVFFIDGVYKVYIGGSIHDAIELFIFKDWNGIKKVGNIFENNHADIRD